MLKFKNAKKCSNLTLRKMQVKIKIRYLNVFFFSFIYLFTLQCCIGFAIHWHESAMGVHKMKIRYLNVFLKFSIIKNV